VGLLEVAADELGLALPAVQVGTRVGDELALVSGAAATERIRLQVMVQELVGKRQFGTPLRSAPGGELDPGTT